MGRILLCTLVLVLSGCLYINGGGVKNLDNNQYSVRCIIDETNCFNIARDTCHGDFVVIKHSDMQLLVSCTQVR